MAFLYNVITSAGANLIAQATAANPIVIIDCYAGNQAANSAEDLASRPLSFYSFGGGYSDGTIFSCSAQDNTARVMMNFNSGHCDLNEPEYIKSACIRGRLQSQSNSEAVIIAALSDSSSEIQIPSSHSPVVNIHLPINIIINADDQVATVGAEYASLADLARFVSMYKAGNPSQGEDQTIKGNKTFLDSMTVYGAASFDDFVNFNNGFTSANDCTIDGEVTINGIANTHAIRVKDAYNPDIFVLRCDSGELVYSYEPDEGNEYAYLRCGLTSDGVPEFDININSTQFGEMGITFTYDNTEGNFSILPRNTNPGTMLGNENTKWYNIYTERLNADDAYITAGSLPHPSLQTGSSNIETPTGSIVWIAVQLPVGATAPGSKIGTSITSSDSVPCYAGNVGTSAAMQSITQRYRNGYTFCALQSILWETTGDGHPIAHFLAMRIS
jgi:hypothetical protein